MSDRVDELVAQLTLDEKCDMVVGKTAWVVAGCERLGIPEWTVSDGPVGVRGRGRGPGLVVPGPSALAATWNVDLVGAIGTALGVEANDRRVQLLLAPTVNIHRVPTGGRHFECYSEDPELTARVAVAYIDGVQSQGVGACIKHFVANDQEYERHEIDIRVDERALREIYLPPFEAAVRRAGVRSVMGAYNYVNGAHACAHTELLTDVLKGEWGFDGFVVSDWGAVKDTVDAGNGGLDLEMPSPGRYWGNGLLAEAVRSGAVAESAVDDKVRRLLGFLEWCGKLDEETDHHEEHVDRPEARALARRAGAESAVLIHDRVGLLPLTAAGHTSVALIGPGVADTAMLGGGSASLEPHRTTTVLDALRARLGDTELVHAPGVVLTRAAAPVPPGWLPPEGATVELFDGETCTGEPVEVLTGRRLLNVWFAESFPQDVESLSVRLSVTLTPDVSGRHRVNAIGFGHAVLSIDGEVVADNHRNGFEAGLGRHAGDGYHTFEAGRRYDVVLEHTPVRAGQFIVITDLAAELDDRDAPALLADAEQAAAAADLAVVVVGSSAEWESEGGDRRSMVLPAGQDELVERVVAANPNTVVVLNCGAPMELPWLDAVGACLLAWYPGQEAGETIADVLSGQAEPSGRMPTTWPRTFADTPVADSYPGTDLTMSYDEGVFVGYRWYDREGTEPLIPFGHGGSYTTFEWGDEVVWATTGDAGPMNVGVDVTNTGDRPGADVVQVYVAPVDPRVERPLKELAGFAKVELEPGDTERVWVSLRDRAFARWDVEGHDWVVDAGEYDVVVAHSATREHIRVRVTRPMA